MAKNILQKQIPLVISNSADRLIEHYLGESDDKQIIGRIFSFWPRGIGAIAQGIHGRTIFYTTRCYKNMFNLP
jgi:hypothetical protein